MYVCLYVDRPGDPDYAQTAEFYSREIPSALHCNAVCCRAGLVGVKIHLEFTQSILKNSLFRKQYFLP